MQTTTQEQFKEVVINAKNILIITSEPMDLDCISSGLITKRYVESLRNEEVKFLFPRKIRQFEQEMNAFIPFFETEFVGQDTREALSSGIYDTLIVLDGGSKEQFYERNNRDLPEPEFNVKTIIQVDHHMAGNFDGITFPIKDITASSTTEILLTQIIPHDFLNEDLATIAYAGLAGDTGNFRYEFNPNTLRLAAMLVEHGARVTEILNAMYSRKTPEFLEALSYAITHMEYDTDTKTIFLKMSNDVLEKDGLTKPQVSLIKDAFKFDIAQSMKDFHRGIVLSEKIPGVILMECRGNHFRNKVSLPELLKHIGGFGGGHFNAAVATYNGNMDEGLNILKDSIKKHLETGSFI